jgi:dCTP deaminase
MSLGWWHQKNPWRYRSRYPGIADERVIFLPPKCTILAHTDEFIGGMAGVTPDMIGWPEAPSTTMMKARSSYGRNFIEVCKCAGYGDVGYTNRWTMEITNNSRFYHIPLVVGRRIAQIVFMETGDLAGTANYADGGKYQGTNDIEELRRNWRPDMMLPRLDKDRDIPVYARARCPHDVPWDCCPDCSH